MSDQIKKAEGLHALYDTDPATADLKVFGRIANNDRRGFLRGAGLASMAAMLGVSVIPYHRNMPQGLIPAAMADDSNPFSIDGKEGLTILNDRPVNAETPAHLLDDAVTPTSRHFIRNNGIPPVSVDANSWQLTIDGLVDKPLTLSIKELQDKFEVVTRKIVVECGGNGRAAFEPPARGNQWTYGAVACAEWTGVRLADVLKAAGVKPGAVYTAHHSADKHLSGKEGKEAISRGVPIEKAMDANNLIAYAMNGEAIHPMNGAPLRLIIPGWPGSCSQKWLQHIEIRDQVHDGAKMTGKAYRVPNRPVSPGEKVNNEDFVIIERMPVKSLITHPANGVEIKNKSLEVRGNAWSGERKITSVEISIDFGASWIKAELGEQSNFGDWQRFKAQVKFPLAGYYEVWAKATDEQGISQPFGIAWNPKGYLNNSMHRVAVRVS
jgi:DMSO/TMAO reductase YedYZ molybdopterin-dependent catalytic subunit